MTKKSDEIKNLIFEAESGFPFEKHRDSNRVFIAQNQKQYFVFDFKKKIWKTWVLPGFTNTVYSGLFLSYEEKIYHLGNNIKLFLFF